MCAKNGSADNGNHESKRRHINSWINAQSKASWRLCPGKSDLAAMQIATPVRAVKQAIWWIPSPGVFQLFLLRPFDLLECRRWIDLPVAVDVVPIELTRLFAAGCALQTGAKYHYEQLLVSVHLH
jgi:hypothetical protein